jgi:hypothetical protein
VQQPLMHRIRFPGIGACTGRNGLDAFALPVSQQPHAINGEGASAALISQDVANRFEIFLEPLDSTGIHEFAHRLTRLILLYLLSNMSHSTFHARQPDSRFLAAPAGLIQSP